MSATPRQTIVHLGPPAETIGGMASVVAQIETLNFRGRYAIAVLPATTAPPRRESLPAKVARHLRQLNALRRMIQSARSPVVHIHTCSGFSFYRSLVDLESARMMRRRVVLHIHGAAFDEFFDRSSSLARRVIRRGLQAADVVIALSESWRETLLKMSPHARVRVVENAVALPVFEREPSDRAEPDASADRCRFILLARMDEWKGIDDLLAACAILQAQHTSYELSLVGPPGSAGDASVLEAKIRRLNLTDCVRYLGAARGVAKDRLLRDADVYVQSSHHEGMPISVLEAFSYGLAVVATRVGAIGEIITCGREGLLVPAHAPEKLARSMARLAGDVCLREQMGIAARALAERRFSLDRFRDDLANVYDALTMRSGTADQALAGHAALEADGSVADRGVADVAGQTR